MASASSKEYQKKSSKPNAEEKPSFWERFAFLSLSFEDKALIAETTLEDIKGDGLYWIQLFMSSLIASFGLLQNSVAVIIGAMLIAPLLRPIKGIAFGISTGQNSILWRSVLLLATSIIITVSSAYVFALFIPLRIETSEIIARTAPNLLDLFIAIASAIIAILAVYYQKLSETTAGVAMAAALLPALCVVGIELSLSNFGAAWGSFFLFMTNIFAILAVGVIIFLIYGFYPHHEDTKLRTTKSVFVLFMLLALIAIPLFSSLTEIANKITLQTRAKDVVEKSLSETIPEAKLETLDLVSFTESTADFFSIIKIPETTDFFLETRNALREQLGNALNREVLLEIEIIPIASIVSQQEQQEEIPRKERQILNTLQSFFSAPELKTTVITLDVIPTEAPAETMPTEETPEESEASPEPSETIPESDDWTIKTVFTLPAGQTFKEDLRQSVEEDINSMFPDDEFRFLWVPLSATSTGQAKVETANERHLAQTTLQWEAFFERSLPAFAKVENLNISWILQEEVTEDSDTMTVLFSPENIQSYAVDFDLFIPQEEQDEVEFFREKMRLFARIQFPHPVSIDMRVFPFTRQQLTTQPQ